MDVELAGMAHPRPRAGGDAPSTGELRERLLAAALAEVAERGYGAGQVAGICVRAGVSRRTFHTEFRGKEACFLAACQDFVDELVGTVRGAVRDARDWEEGVRGGLGALLSYLADHPLAARACIVESLAAGPAVLAVRDLALRAFADLVDLFHAMAPGAPAPSALLTQASVGGVYGIIQRRIREGDTGALPGLVSSLAYFLLAPVVGRPRALELAATAG